MSHWKVIYTQLAERDLLSIYEYIAFSLLEPETARKQARRILDAVAKLNDFPHRFKLYQNEPWLGKGLRVMPVDNYLMFYLTVPTQNIVVIARLMFGGRDISTQLLQTEVPVLMFVGCFWWKMLISVIHFHKSSRPAFVSAA